MSDDRFLIIHFGDNDFSWTLEELGQFVLDYRFKRGKDTKDILKQMNEEGCINEVLTGIFRNLLCLNQNGFSVSSDFKYNIDSMRKERSNYLNSDYFNLQPYFSDYHESDLNCECLVIDFENNISFIV